MNGAYPSVGNSSVASLVLPRRVKRDDAPMSAWLRRALSRQYDAVLAEELPPAMVALARSTLGEH